MNYTTADSVYVLYMVQDTNKENNSTIISVCKPTDSTQRLLQFLLLNIQACVLPAAAYNRLNIYIDNRPCHFSSPCHSLHLAIVSALICPRAPVLAPALHIAGDIPPD